MNAYSHYSQGIYVAYLTYAPPTAFNQVYEVSTETLFVGRQDASQRQSMVPITKWLDSKGLDRSGSGVKLLEVACGTGRFMTFLRDNYPGMDMTASDISPFYLQVSSGSSNSSSSSSSRGDSISKYWRNHYHSKGPSYAVAGCHFPHINPVMHYYRYPSSCL